MHSDTLRSSVLRIGGALFLVSALAFSHFGVVEPKYNLPFVVFQIAGFFFLIALTYFARRGPLLSGLDAFWYAQVFFAGAQLVSAVLNHQTVELTFRTVAWLTVPFYYPIFRGWRDHDLAIAAALALPVYMRCMMNAENDNVYSFAVVGLMILCFSPDVRFGRLALVAVSPLLVITLTCRGAAVGIASALVVSFRSMRMKHLLGVLAILVIAILGFDIRYASLTHYRDQLVRQGLSLFAQSPVWGVGPRQIYSTIVDEQLVKQTHTHNIVVTLLAESGIIGLAALAYFLVTLARHWQRLAVGSRMLAAAFLTWSLIDEPLQWWGINLLFWAGLSRYSSSADAVPATASDR